MCDPTWPKLIGKRAFTEYAAERGWSAEQIEKAWLWCTTRQNRLNIEADQKRLEERLKAVAAAKVEPPCVCQCPRCKAASA
jgi:hypothetical protein